VSATQADKRNVLPAEGQEWERWDEYVFREKHFSKNTIKNDLKNMDGDSAGSAGRGLVYFAEHFLRSSVRIRRKVIIRIICELFSVELNPCLAS
jgi:hypothetical protein